MTAKIAYDHPDQANAANVAGQAIDRSAAHRHADVVRNNWGGFDIKVDGRHAGRVYLDDATIVVHGFDTVGREVIAWTARFTEHTPVAVVTVTVGAALDAFIQADFT